MLDENEIYDIVWVEVDNSYFLVQRCDRLNTDDTKLQLDEHFKFVSQCAFGTASALTGAYPIDLNDFVKRYIKKQNRCYKLEMLKKLY